jgi:RHS repeat-associated protein
MAMPGRKFSSGSGYRYGFNGQERSTEINNNSYTAEFWQYDARLGRRWNIDPVLRENQSPYMCFDGNPINIVDIKGDSGEIPDPPCSACGSKETKKQKTTRIALVTLAEVYNVKKLFSADDWANDPEVTASQLFYQWVKGTGKDKRKFDENSTMGKQMLEAKEVITGIDDAIKGYKDKGLPTAIITRSLSEENPILYAKSFWDDLDDNPARALHGSYSGTATVYASEETSLGVNYTLSIKITDYLSAMSGTRKPPALGGYKPGGSIYNSENPYGLNGNFRTIKVEYRMNIKVFKYNTIAQNAAKAWDWLMH